ncbi:MAG: AlpA family phage regulatory protein [Burkholderiales bacterium]|nr:AlpA family phage regulatory protein [Burkholderiales bacterium]
MTKKLAATAEQKAARWLRVNELATRFGIGRSTLYGLRDFPKPIYLSPGLPVWSEADIEAYEAARRQATPVTPSRGGNRRKASTGEVLA